MVNNTYHMSTTNNYCALPAIDPVTGLSSVKPPIAQQQLVAGRTISFGSSLSFSRNRAERIRDFNAIAGDRIGLSRELFSSIGSIENLRFRVVSGSKGMRAAARTDVNIIYNQRTGGLYYNQNLEASGFGQPGGMFAVLLGKPELSSSNFIIS
jgi:Ca2+-binding RTX toxin-like protein